MSEQPHSGAAQFRADLPDNVEPESVEQEAVRTTIVGGRPPGSGQPVGRIPRGIEVLLKKAAVDARHHPHQSKHALHAVRRRD